MSNSGWIDFVIWFGMIFLWTCMAYVGTFHPKRLNQTNWGKTVWGKLPESRVRIINAVFLLAGLFMLGMAIWRLSHGTFKWRGGKRSYGFSDLWKTEEKSN